MKIVVAMDSFKGSLTSMEAGRAVAEGVWRVHSRASVTVVPVADGGEGTVDTLIGGLGGERQRVWVSDPLGRPIMSEYGILADKTTAVIEMSAAAGLPLLAPHERDPMHTTTYGVGELIRHAVAQGCRRFLIGIGGSATNDGGSGMLQALGFGLLDAHGNPIPRGAVGLSMLSRLSFEQVLPELADCRFEIACDVTNPLCGEQGCSAVFAPQKGAAPHTVAQMDGWLAAYASLVQAHCPHADPHAAGAGAAGGIGFAFLAFLNGTLTRGIDLVLRAVRLDKQLEQADLVITGEGRLDGQTAMGKTPSGVATLAKRHHLPVIAFSGCVTREAKQCHACGIDAYFPILQQVTTLEEAMDPKTAYGNLADTAEEVFRLIQAVQ